ncbi:DNA methyltransferase [Candidatus Spongiihabitans sp.]|uniref:DNA methyltransferase n=1 Tax=Candidatus Spongiihabitans sp. TaxID=3101308 RepID=UPI003C7D3427
MQTTAHKIVTGDARRMRSVGDGAVQLVVTSPPYWQLKDYGGDGQIGFNHSYEAYINHLNLVWSECRRVLGGGCRLCVNIGDQFARSVYYGRYKVIPIKTEIIKFCEAVGFDYMGTIIWQKKTTTNTTGGGAVMGSFPYPRNGIVKIDYESILLFKKTGTPERSTITKEMKEKSRLTNEEWNTYFSGHWRFAGERQNKHIAMFPIELPNRLIKMFSFVGETVLDPFLGSGTTSLSAAHLQRNSIGYEINPEFRNIIREKLGCNESFLQQMKVEFLSEKNTPLSEQSCRRAIAKLPYQFKDTVKMERKIDPKKLAFGSKIDSSGNGQRKDCFYHINKIIRPNKILLSGGIKIRLLGITPVKEREADAISFIYEKTKGQKVFLGFDREKYDREGNLLCYLYLANKTFINAHLIKFGFASADKKTVHRHLTRFIKYQQERSNA